ncbi:MAG: polymer-forming cytoskeletal protein [Armatimonadota bacterium]|nr:polymer-forming cytoskeletal protein [Armatimonadota bacterium]
MLRRRMWSLLVFAAVLGLAAPSSAMDLRAGPAARILQHETIADDLYMAGPYVSVDGQVRGDLAAAGGAVTVRGQTTGDLLLAGGTVDVAGPVGGAVRVMGGTVVVRGTVGTDLLAAGGTVSVDQSARISRDMALAGGEVWFLGSASRNAWIAGSRVEISGAIGGNLVIRASEINLLPTAVVRGNLTYSSERPIQIAEGARVAGTVTQEAFPIRPMPSRQALRGLRIFFGIADFFWMLVVTLVLIAVTPRGVQVTADVARTRPGASLGWGLLFLFTVPLAIVALMITVLGIPAGMLLVLAHLLGLFAGHAAAGLAVGQTVAPRLQSPYAEATIGIGIIAIATNLPYIGWVLRVLVVAVGFGALILVLWQRRTPASPSRPTPVGPAVA